MHHPVLIQLIFLIIQYLKENNYNETALSLEKESKVFFNMKHCEELAEAGYLEEVSKYISGFTGCRQWINTSSRVVETELSDSMLQDIVNKLLDPRTRDEVQVPMVEKPRPQDASGIKNMLQGLVENLARDPGFRDKLKQHNLGNLRLQDVLFPSFYWQHQGCINLKPNPEFKTLFTDHSCDVRSGHRNVYDDLPCIIVANISQGANVKTMEFHPKQHSLLLVGTEAGDVALWQLYTRERLMLESFTFPWYLQACLNNCEKSTAKDFSASVNRVKWSPDSTQFAVAYSRNIARLYIHKGGANYQKKLEITAHNGPVNDIAFFQSEELFLITCGDDKTIKAWDTSKGTIRSTLTGHVAPCFSLTSYALEDAKFIVCTAVDGTTKHWSLDDPISRDVIHLPGCAYTTVVCSGSSQRFISSGTSTDGLPLLMEWKLGGDRKFGTGLVVNIFRGMRNQCSGPVQCDSTGTKLAAGHASMVTYWDIDDAEPLATFDAGGGLPNTPCVKYNGKGTLLAVVTANKCIKILANLEGIKDFHAADGWT